MYRSLVRPWLHAQARQSGRIGETLREVARGARWLSIAAIGPLISRGLTLTVIARLVAPDQFGIYTALLVAVGFADLLGQFGVGAALVQTRDLEAGHETAAVLIASSLGIAIAIVLGLLSGPVSGALGALPGREPLVVLCLAFPIAAVGSVSTSLLQRELAFRSIASAEVTAHVLGYAGVGIVLALLDLGVWALVGAFLARTLFQTVAVVYARPPRLVRFSRGQIHAVLSYGGGLTLARFANYVALQADKLIVSRRLGYVLLGFYGRAYELMALPASLFAQILDRVTFPILSRHQDDRQHLSEFLLLSTRWSFLILGPLASATVLFADELTNLVLGAGWSSAAAPLAVLALALPFRAGSKVADSLLRAVGAVYQRAWIQCFYAVVVVISSVVGASIGLVGVAFGVVAAIILNYTLLAALAGARTGTPASKLVLAHLPGTAVAFLPPAVSMAIGGP